MNLLSGCSSKSDYAGSIYKRAEIVNLSSMAKQLLVDGNKRYVSNEILNDDLSVEKRKYLADNGQHPLAVLVCCSDSRVPPETIFDVWLGDIFVVRDAGNVVDPAVLGSIEYGVEHLKCPLVMVLGHEKCGAVKATVDGGDFDGSIKDILEKIKPSYEKVKALSGTDDIYEKCADENIKNSIAEIEKSPVVKYLEQEHKVQVIGAKYHMETDIVTYDE